MTIEFVVGDLFDQRDVSALAHGVNCHGLMGAGISPIFKNKWPLMYLRYRDLCQSGTLTPGLVYPYSAGNGRWVYNMATQDAPGANARYEWLDNALRSVRLHAEVNEVRGVALPRIGAGIGGLEWVHVAHLMSDILTESAVSFRVVSLPD